MASPIRCFFLEPTDQMRGSLRRYHSGQECPLPGGYHTAQTFIEQEPVEWDTIHGYISNNLKPAPLHTDPRWPTQCACGYPFMDDDEWQRFTEQVYRRVDTGEEMTVKQAGPGAMWYASWLDVMYVAQDPDPTHILMVRTPGGDWCVDAQARNCTMPDDTRQERHHCWIRHGTVPIITVDKSGGPTCRAGAGSIQCHSYHGFLRDGLLTE